MTYRELMHKAERLLDQGKITIGQYEKMTKPLNRQIGNLYLIISDIENDWQLKKYPSSPFSCGLRRAIEIIAKYLE